MTEKLKRWRWKLALNIFTLVALGVTAYFIRDQIYDTFKNLANVNAYILFLMIPFQMLDYHAQAKVYQGLFWSVKERIRYRPLYRMALELNFVNNVFPSAGLSGFSYFSVRMKSGAGVPASKATLVQLMKFVMMFISFQILLFVGLLLLAIGGQASNLLMLVAGSLVTLLIVATLGIAFIIGSQKRINSFFTFIARLINRVIHIFRPNRPETLNLKSVQILFNELHENYMLLRNDLSVLKRPLLYSLIANISEILTIYTVYVAFGQWVNPGAIIIAYAVANFAGFVSVLPGGVGIYEALMTAILAAGGVPAALSLPVTVMYRVINMSIQLPPGYYFYQKALHEKPIEINQAV